MPGGSVRGNVHFDFFIRIGCGAKGEAGFGKSLREHKGNPLFGRFVSHNELSGTVVNGLKNEHYKFGEPITETL